MGRVGLQTPGQREEDGKLMSEVEEGRLGTGRHSTSRRVETGTRKGSSEGAGHLSWGRGHHQTPGNRVTGIEGPE